MFNKFLLDDSTEAPDGYVRIVFSDAQIEIPRKILKNAILLDEYFNQFSTKYYATQYSSNTFEIIANFLAFAEDNEITKIPMPLPEDGLECVPFTDFEKKLIYEVLLENKHNKITDTILSVMICANFFKVTLLERICCAVIGGLSRNKQPKEIYEMFGIPEEDITPEDFENVYESYPWLRE